MLSPLVQVPVKTGFAALVMPSLLEIPLSDAVSRIGAPGEGGRSVKLWSTFGAAPYVVPSPGCDARIVHRPRSSKVALLLATLHVAVNEVKATPRPDDAIALKFTGDCASVTSASGLNAIVCACRTFQVYVVGVAVVLPARSAAFTSKVCGPRPTLKLEGLVHALKIAPSCLHWNTLPASFDEKPNVGF